MAVEIYDASIPLVLNALRCVKSCLKKGQAFAQERKVADDVFLGLRLAPDMFSLKRQVQSVSDNAKGIGARLAGVDVPSWPDTENTFEELDARLSKTIEFLEGLDRSKFDGAETRVIEMNLGQPMTFTGASYLFGFGLPNLMFHVSMSYAIMRHAGVRLGKTDFLRPGE